MCIHWKKFAAWCNTWLLVRFYLTLGSRFRRKHKIQRYQPQNGHYMLQSPTKFKNGSAYLSSKLSQTVLANYEDKFIWVKKNIKKFLKILQNHNFSLYDKLKDYYGYVKLAWNQGRFHLGATAPRPAIFEALSFSLKVRTISSLVHSLLRWKGEYHICSPVHVKH